VEEALFHQILARNLGAPLVVDAIFDDFASRQVGFGKNVSRKMAASAMGDGIGRGRKGRIPSVSVSYRTYYINT
jgi:hypothetical protein